MIARITSLVAPVAKVALSDAAALTGTYRRAARVHAGAGVIIMLHSVVEAGRPILYPGFQIDADHLDRLLRAVRGWGLEIVTIDEVAHRLREGDVQRRFACFVADDGYADNLVVALPVFRRHGAPFTVAICTGMLERSLDYWWGGLQELLRGRERVEFLDPVTGEPHSLWARSWHEKQRAYTLLDVLCHRTGAAFARELFNVYGVDPGTALDRDALTLAQARDLARDPLVTIAAHGITHQRLASMTEEACRHEIREGKRLLERWLDVEVRHVAYPFGGPDACGPREFRYAEEAGFKTGVTTRPGSLFEAHAGFLHCLPRRRPAMDRVTMRNMLSGLDNKLRRQPVFQTV